MDITLQNKSLNIKTFFPKLNKFYYSKWYFVLLFVITYSFWLPTILKNAGIGNPADLSIVSTTLLLLLASLILVTNKDVTPIIPIFVLMVVTVSDIKYLEKQTNITLMIIMGVILAISAIFNLFYYKQQLFKKGKLTIPLLLVSISIFLGGIGYTNAEAYGRVIMYVFTLGIVMLLLYSYMVNCSCIPSEVDSKKYFASILLVIGLVMTAQLITAHAVIGGTIDNHFRASLEVGWGNRQGLGMMLIICMPSAFYLAEQARRFNYLYYLLSFGFYICIFATFSRGAILFGTLELIAIIIYLSIKSNHRKQFIMSTITWVIMMIITICTNKIIIEEIIEKFAHLGANSSGRTDLYKEGWKLFLYNPLFGAGFGYVGPHLNVANNCMYWFHSTIIQVLATLGLNGLICYIIYYIARAKVLLKNRSFFNILLAIGVISFECQCLIDAATFQPFPYVFTVLAINTFVELVNKSEVKVTK